MIKDPATQTKIDSTGLRYKSKVNGSPFGPEVNHLSTRSCFKCGQHKSRALGSMKQIAGKYMFFSMRAGRRNEKLEVCLNHPNCPEVTGWNALGATSAGIGIFKRS